MGVTSARRPRALLRALAWAGAGATCVLAALLLVWGFGRGSLPGHPSFEAGDAAYALGIAMFAVIGALIATRSSQPAIGWLSLAGGAFLTLNDFAHEYVVRVVYLGWTSPGAKALALASVWIWAAGFASLGLLMLRFPTGRLPGSRWRVVEILLVLSIGLAIATAVAVADRSAAFLIEDAAIEAAAGPVGAAAPIALFLALAAAMFSLFVRYRRSRGDERRQLKWVGFAAGILAVYVILQVFVVTPLGVGSTLLGDAVWLLGNLAIVAFPVSVAIAIFRYRLYEIDVIINRALVYLVLTSLMAAIYVLVVLAIGTVARGLMGPGDNDVAVAASTLIVAGLFRPLRAAVQTWIDRRFYRHRYDVRRTVEGFAARMREAVELESVQGDVLRVVNESVQPERVALWLP